MVIQSLIPVPLELVLSSLAKIKLIPRKIKVNNLFLNLKKRNNFYSLIIIFRTIFKYNIY